MTRKAQTPQEILMLPAEVGMLFRVTAKTVTRWVLAGKLGSVKTLGNHNRFHPEEIRKLLKSHYTHGSLEDRLAVLDAMIEGKKTQS